MLHINGAIGLEAAVIRAWIGGVAGLALSLLAAGSPPLAAGQCDGITVIGKVNSVNGNPFQAEVNAISPNGTQQASRPQEPNSVAVMRDSQGRVRVDSPGGKFEVKGQSSKHTEVDRRDIYICDPVGHETISLDTWNKTAIVQSLPPLEIQRARSLTGVIPSFCEAQLHLRANLPNVEIDDLGHRTVEGVDAHGVKETRSSSERRLWCSDELGAMVLLEMDTPEKKGVFHFAMTNIQRLEPAAALFAIPSDYKIVERVDAAAEGVR